MKSAVRSDVTTAPDILITENEVEDVEDATKIIWPFANTNYTVFNNPGDINSYTPSSVISGGNVMAGTENALGIRLRSNIFSPADGEFLFQNNAGNNFTILKFGGQTASFPALRRNGATLEVVTADSANYAPLTAGAAIFDGNLSAFDIFATAGSTLGWSTKPLLSSPVNGQILLTNAAETDFTSLLFGGTSALFPALKRNGAAFQVRLADDSANANLEAAAVTASKYNTSANCNSAASPAVCAAAPAGSVALAAGGTTLVVNTTAVTANSQIFLQFDSSLGTRLGVTCNTAPATVGFPSVTARSSGVSFTISVSGTVTTNPACFSYEVRN